MGARGLGSAGSEVEKIAMVLDPRYKSCCKAVCLNGGQELRESVTDLVETKLWSFAGSAASTGEGGTGASASSSGGGEAGSPEAEGAALGAGGAGSPSPTTPTLSRMEKLKAKRDKEVARPPGDV
ncbi:unnamed protein product, partial [Pylaiella littoralis]